MTYIYTYTCAFKALLFLLYLASLTLFFCLLRARKKKFATEEDNRFPPLGVKCSNANLPYFKESFCLDLGHDLPKSVETLVSLDFYVSFSKGETNCSCKMQTSKFRSSVKLMIYITCCRARLGGEHFPSISPLPRKAWGFSAQTKIGVDTFDNTRR